VKDMASAGYARAASPLPRGDLLRSADVDLLKFAGGVTLRPALHVADLRVSVVLVFDN